MKSEAIRFLGEVHRAMLARCCASVPPILAEIDGVLTQCGTGTLLRIADTCFVVTAAHVAEIETKDKNPLYIGGGADGVKPVRMQARRARQKHGALDVAVWELGPLATQSLESRHFLGLHEVDLGRAHPKADWYYMYGYPSEWSTQGPRTERFLAYGGVLYDGPTEDLANYDSCRHVLFELCTQYNQRFDGQSGEMPQELRGISGSSIWRSNANLSTRSAWKPESAKVIAVQTGCYRAQIYTRSVIEQKVIPVKGTLWCHVWDILWEGYAELRPAMSLWRPQ